MVHAEDVPLHLVAGPAVPMDGLADLEELARIEGVHPGLADVVQHARDQARMGGQAAAAGEFLGAGADRQGVLPERLFVVEKAHEIGQGDDQDGLPQALLAQARHDGVDLASKGLPGRRVVRRRMAEDPAEYQGIPIQAGDDGLQAGVLVVEVVQQLVHRAREGRQHGEAVGDQRRRDVAGHGRHR
nr:hypothetical protein [Parasulfuritortus cantonensis]